MGNVSPSEPPGSNSKGTDGTTTLHRKRSPRGRVRPSKPPLSSLHRERDTEIVPSGPTPSAPRVVQPLHGGWLPRAAWHDAAGELVGHTERPQSLGRPYGFQAGEVRGDRGAERGVQADALWVRAEGVSGREFGDADGWADAGVVGAVLRVGERWEGNGGHGRGPGAHHAQGPSLAGQVHASPIHAQPSLANMMLQTRELDDLDIS